MTNPYRELDSMCFWVKAMTAPAPGHVDPVVRWERIEPHHKVATMGSCFAQHLSKHISSAGFNYFVAEKPPQGLDAETARNRNFGVFSARYGNIYTVRQAVQLFDRAFGVFHPRESVWRKNERFIDAFRPQIEPGGFATADEVTNAAVEHLSYVREVFTQSDWVVLTLGLTEGWRSKIDGTMYPIAPGVAGGTFLPASHEFVNFTVGEVKNDLVAFIERIRSVNPAAKVLLTVSPVPLIATFEKRHVWVSTTFSKAALRVAADEVERQYSNVIYFPAYEIITSPAAGNRYYADDLRQVTPLGVKHVMRLFGKHFFYGGVNAPEQLVAEAIPAATRLDAEVLCDEEVIETALRESGFVEMPGASARSSWQSNTIREGSRC